MMTVNSSEIFISANEVDVVRLRLSFEKIQFSDGTELQLAENDIVVFVGPNNAGKSAALRELEAWVARSSPGLLSSTPNGVKH